MSNHSYITWTGLTVLALICWNIDSRTRKVKKQKAKAPMSFMQAQERRAALAEERADTTEQIPVGFDIEAKRREVVALVQKGVKYFNAAQSVEHAASAFTVNKKEFRRGELHLFLYDLEGTCLANGKYTDMIWKNFFEARDAFGSPYFQEMLSVVKPSGDWVIYQSRGAAKVSYIVKVSKNGKDYILGCGYYPFSKRDATVALVKGAVALFKKAVKDNIPLEFIFGDYILPGGRFTHGDLYVYVVTFEGKMLAHGERSGLIGQNVWDYQDPTGKYVNREIVEKLKETTGGAWVSYISKGALKETYVEKVTDSKGRHSFIACGYYPKTTYEEAELLVQKAYAYLKVSGISVSVAAFNDPDDSEFHYGDLSISVYSTKYNEKKPSNSYKCIADSNEEFVGIDMYDQKDQSGHYFVREIVEKAKEVQERGGWITFKFNNALKSYFVRLANVGLEEYVVCCGMFPVSKHNTMELLAKTAASTLRTADKAKDAFAEFIDDKGQFVQGDLFVFAFNSGGICAAYGTEHDLIWRNLSFMKDEYGVPIITRFMEAAVGGPTDVMVKVYGGTRIAHIEKVDRRGRIFYVGSSFYA